MIYLLLTWGCAHSGMGYPGPLRHMGQTPVPYQTQYRAPAGPRLAAGPGPGDRVSEAAVQMLGRSRLVVSGTSYRYDCSGLVEAVYAQAGLPVKGSAKMLYDQARSAGAVHKRKVPSPGDLAFFDNSHDRNKNGRRDDELTHVSIVEKVAGDGTITLIHLGSKGVVRTFMNLRHPGEHKSPGGAVWNSFLRAPSKRDNGGRLNGELWRAFGSLWKDVNGKKGA